MVGSWGWVGGGGWMGGWEGGRVGGRVGGVEWMGGGWVGVDGGATAIAIVQHDSYHAVQSSCGT